MLEDVRYPDPPALLWFRTGFFGTVVEYGAERKISSHSVLSATVSIGVPQGVSLKIRSGCLVFAL